MFKYYWSMIWASISCIYNNPCHMHMRRLKKAINVGYHWSQQVGFLRDMVSIISGLKCEGVHLFCIKIFGSILLCIMQKHSFLHPDFLIVSHLGFLSIWLIFITAILLIRKLDPWQWNRWIRWWIWEWKWKKLFMCDYVINYQSFGGAQVFSRCLEHPLNFLLLTEVICFLPGSTDFCWRRRVIECIWNATIARSSASGHASIAN